MPTEQKIQQVRELKDRLLLCSVVVATNPTGLKAATMEALRRSLREHNVEYTMVKNTLAHIAAEGADKPELKGLVQGPTALALGYANPTEVAKALAEFIQSSKSTLTIQGALLGQRVLSSEEVSILASLPPKEEIIAQLMSQLQAPMTRLVGQLQAPLVTLVRTLRGPMGGLGVVLSQRVQQLQSQS